MPIHPTKVSTFLLVFALSHYSIAQTKISADAGSWVPINGSVTFDKETIHVMNNGNATTLLWLNNMTMKNGVVELDIKGKDVAGQSFVGVAFHGTGDDDYEAVYFRPFNFRNPEKKNHALQYISKPEYDWSVLRQRFPGKYENSLEPAPDPNDWFHVRLVIEFPMVRAYVNNSTTPVLEVEQISERKDGKLGLWVDSEDGWFRNVTISKK
jgi:hypothetical protein